MAYSDKHMKIREKSRRDKPKEELYRKYYDLMGVLLYKNDYIQAKHSGIKSNYMYYVMLLNVSDTH